MNTISSVPYKLLTTSTFLEDAIKTIQTANELAHHENTKEGKHTFK